MTFGSITTRARVRWVRLRIPPYPYPEPARNRLTAAQDWRAACGPRHGPHGQFAGRRRGHRAAARDAAPARRRERELRAQREQLIHLARIGLLGELSAALVHELNQPLAAILANAQAGRRLGTAAAPDALVDILDDIVEASQRATSVIQRMRALFQRRETRRERIDFNAVARDALALARPGLAARGVRLALSLDQDALPLRGDPIQLQQVLLNLILNACDAMDANPPGARRLAVATAAHAGRQAVLTVADSGPGIAARLIERVFDSFFTTKPQGLGVGLAVSREIVAAHGGRIEAANRHEGGAVFRVTLPMTAERHHV